jgi:hydrogenase nickel incorporation protein HypA/HybF
VHELSLARSLLDIVLAHAEKNGAIRVERLVLSFGRMSCIEPTALETAFHITAAGTPAEGARLTFEVLPVVLYCLSCEKEYTSGEREIPPCPICGGAEVVVTGGTDDLSLIEMEVEAKE